jgi:hypothetical protein
MFLSIGFGKSTPPQNRQLIACYYQLKYQEDGVVGLLWGVRGGRGRLRRGLGFEVWGLGFGVWGWGLGVWAFDFGLWALSLGL